MNLSTFMELWVGPTEGCMDRFMQSKNYLLGAEVQINNHLLAIRSSFLELRHQG